MNTPGSPIIPLNAPVLQGQGHGQSSAATTHTSKSTLPLPVILPLTISIPPAAPLTPPTRGRSRRGQRQRASRKPAPVSPSPPPSLVASPITRTVKPSAIPSIAVSPVLAPSAAPPSKPLTPQQVQQVESMIERCLHLYMNQEEVVMALQIQANISPAITRHVWQGMEVKSGDFFRAYEVRLKIKEQITAFNYLVSQQAQVTEKTHSNDSSGSADNSSFSATSTSSSFSSSSLSMAPLSFLPFASFNPLISGLGNGGSDGGGYEPLPSPFSMPAPAAAAPPSYLPLTSSLSSLLAGVQPVSILSTSTESALTLSTNSLINSFLKSSSDAVPPSSPSTASSSSSSALPSYPSSSASSSSSLSFAFGPPPSQPVAISANASASSSSLLSAPTTGPLLSSGSFAMPFISVENMDAPSTPFSPFALFSSQPITTSLSSSDLFAGSAATSSAGLSKGSSSSSSNAAATGALPVPNQMSLLGQQLNGISPSVSPLSTSPTPESFLTSSISSIPLTASTNALLDALSGGTSPLRLSPLLTASNSSAPLPLNSSLDGFFPDLGPASGELLQRRGDQ